MSVSRIGVGGPAPYDVLVGRGLRDQTAALVPGAERVAVIHAPTVPEIAERVAGELAGAGIEPVLVAVPDGEDAKTLTVAEQCWDTLGARGFTRTDAVVGVGGGATTDLAGWVAAAWLRGVRVLQVPTTLAGMVDAAVGGKTGINTARGKNLVGAFHPPVAVVCDLDVLTTLSADDYVAGLAEVIKCGFIADPAILDLVESDPKTAATAGGALERELVERSIRVKADVVGADLTEQGRREILNYGHTLGHAIERLESYRWRHGQAVAIGLVFAAALGHRLGRLDEPTAARHRAILELVGLPTRYRAGAFDELYETMRIDKKARGAKIRFVVLDGLARPVTVTEPDRAVLLDAYAEVSP